MQLPRRRLIVCLSLTALCVAGWVRSYYHADTLIWGTARERYAIGLQPGRILVIHNSVNRREPESFTRIGLHFYGPPWDAHRRPMPWIRDRLGIVYVSGWDNNYDEWTPAANSPLVSTLLPMWLTPPDQSGIRPDLRGLFAHYTVMGLPFRFFTPVLLAPLLPVLYRRLRPLPAHLCPACGYDLRATPERCPECGRGVTDGVTTPSS